MEQPLLSGNKINSCPGQFFRTKFQSLSCFCFWVFNFFFFVGFELEQRSESVEKDNGQWSSYQYLGRTGSVIPTASSLAGTEVSVDEIRYAAANASSSGYYPPSLHGALVGSPDPHPYPTGVCFMMIIGFDLVFYSHYLE